MEQGARSKSENCPIAWGLVNSRSESWRPEINQHIPWISISDSLEFGIHGYPVGNNSPSVIYKNHTLQNFRERRVLCITFPVVLHCTCKQRKNKIKKIWNVRVFLSQPKLHWFCSVMPSKTLLKIPIFGFLIKRISALIKWNRNNTESFLVFFFKVWKLLRQSFHECHNLYVNVAANIIPSLRHLWHLASTADK